MLYLLDASVPITAHNSYYALDRVPEYWDWLLHHGEAGSIKFCDEVYLEVEDGSDSLSDWMALEETKVCLKLNEDIDGEHIAQVMAQYGDDLSEDGLHRGSGERSAVQGCQPLEDALLAFRGKIVRTRTGLLKAYLLRDFRATIEQLDDLLVDLVDFLA